MRLQRARGVCKPGARMHATFTLSPDTCALACPTLCLRSFFDAGSCIDVSAGRRGGAGACQRALALRQRTAASSRPLNPIVRTFLICCRGGSRRPGIGAARCVPEPLHCPCTKSCACCMCRRSPPVCRKPLCYPSPFFFRSRRSRTITCSRWPASFPSTASSSDGGSCKLQPELAPSPAAVAAH